MRKFSSTVRIALIVLVIVVLGVVLFDRGRRANSEQDESPISSGDSEAVKALQGERGAKASERGGVIKSPLQVRGDQLVKEAREALRLGDRRAFERVIGEIVHRYEGDPNPLLLQFNDVLNHDDPRFRVGIAAYFLLADLKVGEVVAVLIDIIRSGRQILVQDEKDDGLKENFPDSDLRFSAADLLALYHVEKARDEIWKLYEETKSERLIRPLRRLNDPRIIEVLGRDSLKQISTLEGMRVVGEFRVKEALPTLVDNYNSSKSGSDGRFRTLYPLWRLTGDDKYFDEFAVAFGSGRIPIPYLAVGGEREKQYLVEMLDTESSNTLIKAAMALHLRFRDDGPLVKMLTGYFEDVSSSNWKDGVLARRLVGSIGDADLTRLAEDYEKKYNTGFHERYAVYRKDWRYPEWEETLFMD